MEETRDASAAMQQQPLMRMKVMVAIDDSKESFVALKWVLDNLYGIAGVVPEAGMLTMVHVQEPFQQYFFPAGPAFYGGAFTVVESVKKAKEEMATALLARALQMCKDKMVKAETLIVEGDPKDKICELAEEMHIDLLVVGSRGLGKIKRAFLGSVSDYCAHHAMCPIVIVKPPKEHNK
ncbi:hypothetical protein LWI28_005454 [Acer negundo]|uniref:UspA domain-containing protein n=1 Tax=Acer negundo TaxID=4023 RepID=A0AAD5I566_ACENE|nr:hypothetical protein LWI28_005454 [Acer negundo]KAK4833661.1 hypothetical protein QYF36_009014 [Acer negundo]